MKQSYLPRRFGSDVLAHLAGRKASCTIIAMILSAAFSGPTFAGTEQPIWKFNGGTDGSLPYAGLISDSAGNLYGTTNKGGTGTNGVVFELSPPAVSGGAWTETVLWKFTGGANGSKPYAGVIMDSTGNLYGTTLKGGKNGDGIVFELSPPATPGGSWTETVLYKFDGGAGGLAPYGGLLFDKLGNLYGTASAGGSISNAGVVYELSPPAISGGSWTQQTLYKFSGGADGKAPMSALIADASGDLYGTASAGGSSSNGVVFELMPPAVSGGSWTDATIYAFTGTPDGSDPQAALVADTSGNLYGTTLTGGISKTGAVFKLSPPATSGGSWTESVIHSFSGAYGASPRSTLVVDTKGNLYGTTAKGGTNGNGVVFELSPPAVSGGKWTQNILYRFLGGADGGSPYSGLLPNSTGSFFGTATKGGTSGNGVVYQVTP